MQAKKRRAPPARVRRGRDRVSHQTCYRARRGSAAFGRAWDAALVVARGAAEAKLADYAMNGIEEEVWYHGEHRGERRRFSDRLLLAHLARLDRMRGDERIEALAEDFDGMILRLRRGEPIEAACARLQPLLRRQAGEGGAARGVVVVLGDDRGLLDDDEALVARLAGEAGAPLLRVSLGGVVLFSSHSIVLLHHYLDKLLHACALRPPRDLLAKAKGVLGGPSYKGSYKG